MTASNGNESQKRRLVANQEKSRPRPTREIFLLFNRSLGNDREILRGIYEFAYPTHRWHFFFGSQTSETIEAIAKAPNIAGVIGKLGREDLSKAASKLTIPVVNVHGADAFPGLSQIGVDRYQQGVFAANWFLEQGFPNFGFFGISGEAFSEAQQAGFSDRIEASNEKVHTWTPTIEERSAGRIGLKDKVLGWLVDLPKPIAFFCASDIIANELSMFCLQSGLSIPKDIVILGSDNDELLCMASLPALSSMRLPYRQVGSRAAAILEEKIKGNGATVHKELINQPEIVERQSTTFKHVEDAAVEKALQWMMEHAAHGINVESAARVAGVSLRALEIRFKKALGHSPGKELNRIRLEAVKQILREQDKTLDEIAEACSFSSGVYLSQFFRREAGITPGAYRKAFRDRTRI